MKMWKIVLPIAAILLFAGQAAAQSDEEEERARMEASRVKMEASKAEYSVRLREAEERMEAAVRQIAEITRERLPQLVEIERRFAFSNRPRIGITIDGSEDSGPVDGVHIEGVTPESAADDAGLRAGDVITAVNGETLHAKSSDGANELLLDFMHGVEEGDELKLDYLRNGNAGSVLLSPHVTQMHAFSWVPDVDSLHMPNAPHIAFPAEAVERFRMKFGFPLAGSAWGSMELIELSEGLGKYFGTDTGLLVVSAPKSDGIDLLDGDVILKIADREPKDVRHAMRILSSYQSGEKLTLGIMRDKKKRTLEIEVPADHRGSLFAPPAIKPAQIPVPPKPAPENVST